MPTTKSKRSATAPRRPEQKYGPFHGGVSVAVWLNEVETEDGTRYFRSVTVSPRRFRELKTGEWKDASSLRATDLPALILGLQAAFRYVSETPLPGESIEEEPELPEDTPPAGNGEVPF